jgi:peptidoglycan L-alanyl-D-glutamate endopeptidase CwlK
MSYQLSQRSLNKLNGVHPDLVKVVKKAITLTKIDFGVTQGLRTLEQQRALLNSGATQTMNSKHLTGHAVDLVAYIGSDVSWQLNVYDDLADAMKEAAIELSVPVRWGAAWTVPDIRLWEGTMEEAMMSYVDTRRSQGKRPFIDGPHFELI